MVFYFKCNAEVRLKNVKNNCIFLCRFELYSNLHFFIFILFNFMNKIIALVLPLAVVLSDLGTPISDIQFKLYLFILLLQFTLKLQKSKNVKYTIALFNGSYLIFSMLIGLFRSISDPVFMLIFPLLISLLGTIITLIIYFTEKKLQLKNWLSISLYCFVILILSVAGSRSFQFFI